MKDTTFLSGAKQRLFFLAGILFLWLFAVAFRLVSLQVIHYRDWMQRAQKQQQRCIEVAPSRGVIYDRNGQQLAMSIQVDSIFAVPGEVPDHATAATLLASVLDADARELRARLDNAKNFTWVARKVDPETSARVRALNLRGIYFQKEPKRFYPKRELAAQVVGFVGLDDEGLAGIESNFDETLRGIPGRMRISVDARRKRLDRVERQPEPGQNLVLTIDQNMQYIAERELQRAMEDTHADAGTVVVQNPRTGEILALANRPTFNPNTFRASPQALKNRAVSDIYEPGSMFKTVTISAALEENVTNPDERFDVSQGFIVVGGARMRDAHRMGVLSVAEVIAQSSNVGAIKIGMRLGEERLYKYIRAYGFGAPTGIELPGETRGLVKPVHKWSKTSIGAMSMGQEIGITALQAISAVSSIANDGVYSAPRIVAGITPPNAGPQNIVFHPAEQRRVISTLTAAQMRKMMEGVVLFGTGRRAILDGYSSAGKTGTAQKVDPRTGRYSPNKYVASFIGFAPVNTPTVTVAVILDSAVGLHQGGQVCAPVFARVAQQVLAAMNVPHDTELKNPSRLLLRARVKDNELDEDSPDHPGEALQLAELSGPNAPGGRAERNPRPAEAVSRDASYFVPAAMASVQAPDRPITKAADSGPLPKPAQPGITAPAGAVVVDVEEAVVPALVGKSLRAAIEAAQQAGIQLEAHGYGIAREQSPPPGTRIPAGGKVAVRFSR